MENQQTIRVACVVWLAFVLLALPVLAAGQASEPVLAKGSGGDMALVPAGEFVMGEAGGSREYTPHSVKLKAFYLDRCEVTNAQYRAFCEATKRALPMFWGMDEFRSGPGYPDHPVVGVSWEDAAEYAAWCGKRLPTEAEWEYAARGGHAGRPYPNGDKLDPSEANFARSAKNGPVAVGSYPPNGYGLHDMTGNVAEWVADLYDAGYYQASPADNPPGPASGRFRVVRGGGWHTGPGCVRIGFRNALPGNFLDFNVGFRCARDLP